MRLATAHSAAFAFVLASFWSLSSDTLAQPATDGQAIQWETDLRAAHTRAQQENKHLLLHFYSDNCVWCERLEAGAFKSPQVIDSINQNYIALKIHAGQNPSLAKTFRVSSFPTDVIVTTQGTALAHGTSPQAPDRYIAMLAQHLPQQTAPQTQPSDAPPQTMLAQNVSPTSPGISQNPYGGQPITMPATADVATTTPVAAVTMPSAPVPAESVPTAATGTSAKTVAHRSGVTAADESPSEQPQTLAMDGYCAVTLLEKNEWLEGNPKFGVIHLGHLYLFVDGDAMQRFLAQPEPFTPVLNGIDVVRFFEEKRIVQGKRDFGVRDPDHNRMFFFADEAALIHFENQHARYTEAAISVTRQAAAEANPRR
ncbi:MAG TPA: protein-disulfide isomerase [Planctomycetaceae bacterium]|nr:protein-disulfide isomerase [Planctomycetaceae bacterium]